MRHVVVQHLRFSKPTLLAELTGSSLAACRLGHGHSLASAMAAEISRRPLPILVTVLLLPFVSVVSSCFSLAPLQENKDA
jgi:hypothetical protein